MNYATALEHMRAGRRVRRAGAPSIEWFKLVGRDSFGPVKVLVRYTNGRERETLITRYESGATDWEVIDPVPVVQPLDPLESLMLVLMLNRLRDGRR